MHTMFQKLFKITVFNRNLQCWHFLSLIVRIICEPHPFNNNNNVFSFLIIFYKTLARVGRLSGFRNEEEECLITVVLYVKEVTLLILTIQQLLCTDILRHIYINVDFL